MKKLTALIMALVLMLSCLPTTVLAQEGNGVEAVDKLTKIEGETIVEEDGRTYVSFDIPVIEKIETRSTAKRRVRRELVQGTMSNPAPAPKKYNINLKVIYGGRNLNEFILPTEEVEVNGNKINALEVKLSTSEPSTSTTKEEVLGKAYVQVKDVSFNPDTAPEVPFEIDTSVQDLDTKLSTKQLRLLVPYSIDYHPELTIRDGGNGRTLFTLELKQKVNPIWKVEWHLKPNQSKPDIYAFYKHTQRKGESTFKLPLDDINAYSMEDESSAVEVYWDGSGKVNAYPNDESKRKIEALNNSSIHYVVKGSAAFLDITNSDRDYRGKISVGNLKLTDDNTNPNMFTGFLNKKKRENKTGFETINGVKYLLNVFPTADQQTDPSAIVKNPVTGKMERAYRQVKRYIVRAAVDVTFNTGVGYLDEAGKTANQSEQPIKVKDKDTNEEKDTQEIGLGEKPTYDNNIKEESKKKIEPGNESGRELIIPDGSKLVVPANKAGEPENEFKGWSKTKITVEQYNEAIKKNENPVLTTTFTATEEQKTKNEELNKAVLKKQGELAELLNKYIQAMIEFETANDDEKDAKEQIADGILDQINAKKPEVQKAIDDQRTYSYEMTEDYLYGAITENTTFYAVFGPKDTGEIKVKYVDTNNNDLVAKNILMKGQFKENESLVEKLNGGADETITKDEAVAKVKAALSDNTAQAPVFVGYEFKEVQGDASLTYKKENPSELKFVYEKKDDVIGPKDNKDDFPKGYVAIKFLADEDGQSRGTIDTNKKEIFYGVNPYNTTVDVAAQTIKGKKAADDSDINVNFPTVTLSNTAKDTWKKKETNNKQDWEMAPKEAINSDKKIDLDKLNGSDLTFTAQYVKEQGTVKYEYTFNTEAVTDPAKKPANPNPDKPKDVTKDVGETVTVDNTKPDKKILEVKDSTDSYVIGTWKFQGWKVVGATEPKATTITVKKGDNKVTGEWKYEPVKPVKATYKFVDKDAEATALPAEADGLNKFPSLTNYNNDTEYYPGQDITLPAVNATVKGNKVVDGDTQPGTWTFNGWFMGNETQNITKYTVKSTDTTPINFVGKWTFKADGMVDATFEYKYFKAKTGGQTEAVTDKGNFDPKATEKKTGFVGNSITLPEFNTNTDPKKEEKVSTGTLRGTWKFDKWYKDENCTQEATDAKFEANGNKFYGKWVLTEDTKYGITYEFKSDDTTKTLPAAVKNQIPSDTDTYYVGAPVNVKANSFTNVADVIDGKQGTWKFVSWNKQSLTVSDTAANNKFIGTWKWVERQVRPVDPTNPDQKPDEVEVIFKKGEHGTLSGLAIVNGQEEPVSGRAELAYYVKNTATWKDMEDYTPKAIGDANWTFSTWDPTLPIESSLVKEGPKDFTAQYIEQDLYVTLTLDENYRGGRVSNYDAYQNDLIEGYLYRPRRKGYVFEGWSYNSRRLDEVRPGDRINYSTTLYAIWSKQKAKDDEEVEPIDTREVGEHKAYMFGYTDGTVRPNGYITRAEAAALVTRLLGLDTFASAAEPAFTDTPSSWYNKAINAAVNRGIMKGYPDKSFRPNAPITRAEFTQMISTIDNKPYGVAPFADVVGHWAERPIGSEYQAGRIKGYPDGTFRPNAFITRAEAVVILNKIFERNYDAMSAMNAKNKEYIKRFIDLAPSFWGFNDMVEATNTHLFKRRVKGAVQEDWVEVK